MNTPTLQDVFIKLPAQSQAEVINFANFLLDKYRKQTVVRKDIGVCGGQARIRDTRIPVWLLVELQQQGADDAELLENYPALEQSDLMAVWRYYVENQEEIDLAIREQNEAIC